MTALKVARDAGYLMIVPVVRNWVFFAIMACSPLLLMPLFNQQAGFEPRVVVGYCVMVVMNSCLTQVANAVAAERTFVFERWLQAFPCPFWPRFAGKLAGVFATSMASVLPLLLVMLVQAEHRLSLLGGALLAAVAACLHFGLIGAILGSLLKIEALGYVTNLVFLALSVVGGVFVGAVRPPFVPSFVFDWLPSTIAVGMGAGDLGAVPRFLIMSILVATAAWWTIRVTEDRNY